MLDVMVIRIEHAERHLRAARALPAAVEHLVAFRGHPGEVVHVALHVVVGGLAVGATNDLLGKRFRAHDRHMRRRCAGLVRVSPLAMK